MSNLQETIDGLDRMGDELRCEIADLEARALVLDDAKQRLIAQQEDSRRAREQAIAS